MSRDDNEELKVTFNPPLYLQRQRWLLDILRREVVESVLDIGCGEGSLLQCLAVPSHFKAPSNLPAGSPFLSGPTAEYHKDLHLKELHGLDPSPDLEFAVLATAPLDPDEPPSTEYGRWRTRQARWAPLQVKLWKGGFQNINEDFARIDAFVASEVIEHLSPDLLPLFAPILLGHYRPRLVLLTTPNFTYNQRFSCPGEDSSTGYLDPTGRTDRIFRHHDHKFEWTTEEWKKFCTDAASEFCYEVEVSGVGLAVEPDPWDRDDLLGFASQVAVFKRLNSQPLKPNLSDLRQNSLLDTGRPILRATYIHLPHPLTLEELDRPPDMENIREAVKDAMNYNGAGAITFENAWNHGAVSLACGGDIAALVKAFQKPNSNGDEEWLTSDEFKGWEGMVIWKNYVTPEEDILPQLDLNSQCSYDSPGEWDTNGIEEAQSDGPLTHQEAERWGEGYAWGSITETRDAWGLTISTRDGREPASL